MREFVLIFLLLHLTACSGLQTVPVQAVKDGGEGIPLHIGDRVELVTHDNEKLEFAVTDITDEGLGGKFGFIPYDEVRRLRVHRPGARHGENLTWLWGVLGLAALVGLAVASDSVTVCSGAPCPQSNSD